MPHRTGQCAWVVAIGFFAFTPAAHAQVIIPNDIYTADYNSVIKHYSSTGAFVNSFSISATYGSEVKGMAYGPDGLMYATVGIDAGGFNVVALNSAGNVVQSYSGSEGVNGNLSYGKIGFATNGQFFVAGQNHLRRFTVGNPTGTVVYTSLGQVFDVKGLPWGNLLVLSGNQIQEITTSGAVVRTINTSISLASAMGIEYYPATDSIYVTMFGFTGQFYRVMRINGQNGLVEKNVMYTQPDDLSLTVDNKLLVGSGSLNVGIFDLDLNQIGSLPGGQQNFVMQFAAVPEPSSFVLLGLATVSCVVQRRRK